MSSDIDTGFSDEDSVTDLSYAFGDEDDALRPQVRHLGLSRNYTPTWGPAEGFRELYQNWCVSLSDVDSDRMLKRRSLRRDAIIHTFNLDPRAFIPVITETPARIVIKVHTQPTIGARKRLLGFIRFTSKTGLLEMTNFHAQLDLAMLNMGTTDKKYNDNLAGYHGEGFKLAAAVMCRNGQRVRYSSASYYWTFGFAGTGRSRALRCRLTAAKSDTVARKMSAYTEKAIAHSFKRGLTSNIWQDVTVRISPNKRAGGQPFSAAEFRSWLKLTIDLDSPNPDKVVQTCHGDLVVDENFSGRIYLKGLQGPGHGPDGKKYAFCYNFLHGRISRDRELLTDHKGLGRVLMMIWGEAIDQKGDAFTDRYISLLQTNHEAPDVCMAEEYIAQRTAEAIWSRLRISQPHAFFYSDQKKPVPSIFTEVGNAYSLFSTAER